MESWTSTFWEENAAVCLGELKKKENWEKIPLINSTPNYELKEGSLVRFCGMIQDMYNPVYYLASYEVLNTVTNEKMIRSGKYKDSLQCAENERVMFESDESVNKERRPVYCISVPATNPWAQYKKNEPNKLNGVYSELASSTSGLKRSADDAVEISKDSRVSSGDEPSKRLCGSNSMEIRDSAQVVDLNLPIPNSQAQACLVNFYDVEENQLKMNSVVEVVGFLSYDPALVTSSVDEVTEQLPPPSLVPRLHAVAMKPVRSCNPLLTPQITLDEVMMNAHRLRGELRLLLTQLLLGDDLAADYLICHLISHIYMRQDMLVLGKFSLNLSNLPRSLPDYAVRLYDFLQGLLVKSHLLPMTIHNMNTINMIPRKNYDTNRLESGMLQLSDRTHLVVDETQLQPGQLNDRGVRNCRALGSVITNQRLEYDFQFYPVEFNTDIPVLILSEGKSMLPSDFHVALEADPSCLSTANEIFTAAAHYLQEPLLSQLRVYVSLAGTSDYDLTPEVQQIVQEDFVEMRKAQPKTSAQDLHSLLVLAKLLSLSQGARVLSKECWEAARQMEHQRKQRLLNSNRY